MSILIKVKNSFFQNIKAIIFLQLLSIIILILYYSNKDFNILLNQLKFIKEKYGILAVMITTSISGGIFPEILNKIFKKNYIVLPKRLLLISLFWLYKGFEINLFYTFLSKIVNTNNIVYNVIIKVAIDEFLYTPLWAVPSMIFYYSLSEKFSLNYFFESLKANYLLILILNWLIWIPAVSLIYSLPLALQMPIQNIILVIWTILILFFNKS
jgi:hypothetical protein